MFGMGFFEIFIVLIIAIIFLGPEKLPQALIDVARFFKAVKKTLEDAKTSIDKELNLEEFKKEALEYKHAFRQNFETLSEEVKIAEEIKIADEIKALDEFKLESSTPPSSENLQQKNEEKAQSLHVQPSKTKFKETSYKDS